MAKVNTAQVQRVMTRKVLIVTSIAIAVILAFVLFSSHGLVSRWSLSSEHADLTQQIEQLRTTEDSLRKALQILTTDTAVIERIARERYGYIKPGEKVYVIEQDSVN